MRGGFPESTQTLQGRPTRKRTAVGSMQRSGAVHSSKAALAKSSFLIAGTSSEYTKAALYPSFN